jgi:phage repressor protein C with HTH and peptisase S24 domain
MEGVHDRLRQFLKYEKITQQRVADDMGRTLQYVNGMVNGRSSIGKKVAARLQELYGVSSGWLLTGDGTMFAPSANNEPEVVSDVPVVTMEPTKGRPYYNVDFRLGFDIMTNDQTVNPDYMIDFPPYNDVDCWVNAHGDSMAPTISSGDIVALKRIDDHSYLINGEIYAIVTTNGLRTIKRVRDNGETFTLIADNQEVGEQVIPKQLVTHVYHVRGTIKMF